MNTYQRKPGDQFIHRPRVKHYRLRRVLGVAGLFSSAYGNVGSSIYYALGVTALYALGLTPVVFIVTGLLFGCTALSYAEGAAAIPEAGGASSFARRAFNELVSFVAGWAQMLDYIITIAISAFAVPNYLAFFYPPLKVWPANSAVAIALVAVLAAINVRGVRESSRLNVLLALLDLGTQALLVAISLVLLFNPQILLANIQWGEAPTWGHLIYGISISTIAYTGIATIANLAEETRNPGRDLPRSVGLVFITVISMFTLIPMIALSAMPVVQQPDGTWATELGTVWLQDPVMGIVDHLPVVLRVVFGAWVGVLAATILTIATNAAILGISRLTYSMGQHRQLPPVFSRIHHRYHTPYVAIIIFSILAALLLIPGELMLLADLYAFGAMLAYTFAHLSVIALRVREPEMPRPFKIPVNLRLWGGKVPLTSLIGVAGTSATWAVVVATHELGRLVGFGWLAAGILLYVIYRRQQRLSLTKSAAPEGRRAVDR